MTDLEVWFMEFGDVRNTIIHSGEVPELMYPVNPVYQSATVRSVYHGHFFSTAEFMLRGVNKALLASKLGYEDIWRPQLWRAIKASWPEEDRDRRPYGS